MCEISIAIPVYNVEKYVEKSLLSALNQNFEKNYEILVIDDCGQDHSMETVERLALTHPNGNKIRILRHPQNKGLGPARNTAIEKAQGKYIFFLDSDDWISPNCISVLYKVAEETNAEVTVGSTSRIQESSGRTIDSNRYNDAIFQNEHVGIWLFLHKISMHIELWNKLMRLDFIRNHKLQCVHKVMEDVIFDFRLRSYASRIAFVHNITLFYNVREGSILTTIMNSDPQNKKQTRKKGSYDSAFAYSDIIPQMQKCICKEFFNVPGIYDYYYYRCLTSFRNLLSSIYTKDQKIMCKKNIKGFNDFIPNLKSLSFNGYRFDYLMSKIIRNNYPFTYYTHQFYKMVMQVLKKLRKRQLS